MTIFLKPFDTLSGRSKYASILLNVGKTEIPRLQEELWNDSIIRICSARGAEVIRRLCSDAKLHFPTEIVGDVHSLAIDVKELFHGWSKFHQAVDKNKTCLTACLAELAQMPEIEHHKMDCVIVLGGLTSSRLDCLFGTLNSLLLGCSLIDLPIYAIDGRHLAIVLTKGKYAFEIDLQKTTKSCGLAPLMPCRVKTDGFQWNIDNKELQFGGLVSTSNQIISEQLMIETTGPLVFSMELAHLWQHKHKNHANIENHTI